MTPAEHWFLDSYLAPHPLRDDGSVDFEFLCGEFLTEGTPYAEVRENYDALPDNLKRPIKMTNEELQRLAGMANRKPLTPTEERERNAGMQNARPPHDIDPKSVELRTIIRSGGVIECPPRLYQVLRRESDGTLTVLAERQEWHRASEMFEVLSARGEQVRIDPQPETRERHVGLRLVLLGVVVGLVVGWLAVVWWW